MHEMKLQAKNQYLIMLILAYFPLAALLYSSDLAAGLQHSSFAEINSRGKYIHPFSILQTQFLLLQLL